MNNWCYEVVKASTKKGERLLDSASWNYGYSLADVYGRYSEAKRSAYDECWKEYTVTEESCNFWICSYNTSKFSVRWAGLYNGERAIFYITADHNRVILLDK